MSMFIEDYLVLTMREDDDLSEIYVYIYDVSVINISKDINKKPHSVILKNRLEYAISDKELDRLQYMLNCSEGKTYE